jgi:hypothetical protein
MSHEYKLGSYKLVSDIELPELAPWRQHASATAVLRFKVGQAAAIGEHTHIIAGPPRISVEGGIQVTVEPIEDGDLADTRALLMGPVQAILWHQRGLLPLHASSVSIKGKAIAIAGDTGAGKSTLAAALAGRGCSVLADDISIIDPQTMSVLPGQRRLRLWRSALEQLGISPVGLPRAMSRSEKFVLRTGDTPISDQQTLAHVIFPVRRRLRSAKLERLRGSDAILALTNVVHMLPAAHEMGRGAFVFRALTQMQQAGVNVWRFYLADDLAALEEASLTLLAELDV